MSQSLKQFQREFSHTLLTSETIADTSVFTSHHQDDLQRRLNVYRNNVMHSLTTAAADLYPVTQQLVGEAFFKGLATRYIRQHPPTHAAMVFFAEEFADFVFADDACRSLKYLSDVAHFELERHRSYHAADKTSLNLQHLTALAPEQVLAAILMPHPSLRLNQSNWPIWSIWNAHQQQPVTLEHIQMNQKEYWVHIRPEYQTISMQLDAATFQLIKLLCSQHNIQSALSHCLETHPDFDAPAALANCVNHGFFSDLISSPVTETDL